MQEDVRWKIPDPLICSRCKGDGEDTMSQSFVDFTVICAEGEEGFAWVRQWFCDDCLPWIQEGLMALGFKDHHHGGIDFLEDENCPVYKREGYPPSCDHGHRGNSPYDAGQLDEVSLDS